MATGARRKMRSAMRASMLCRGPPLGGTTAIDQHRFTLLKQSLSGILATAKVWRCRTAREPAHSLKRADGPATETVFRSLSHSLQNNHVREKCINSNRQAGYIRI